MGLGLVDGVWVWGVGTRLRVSGRSGKGGPAGDGSVWGEGGVTGDGSARVVAVWYREEKASCLMSESFSFLETFGISGAALGFRASKGIFVPVFRANG